MFKIIQHMPAKDFMPSRQLPGRNPGELKKLCQGETAHSSPPAEDDDRLGCLSLSTGYLLKHDGYFRCDQFNTTPPGLLPANLLVKGSHLGPLGIIEDRHVDRPGDGRLCELVRAACINQQGTFFAQGQRLFQANCCGHGTRFQLQWLYSKRSQPARQCV